MENLMHPVRDLLLHYYEGFQSLKEEHSDLSNLDFHKSYGLSLACPENWPLIESVGIVASDAVDGSNGRVLIIYNSTDMYDQLVKLCPQNPNMKYLSWQEIFVAMARNDSDVRILQDVKKRISEVDLVFFVGASSALSDVVNWVKNFCSSCLIVLG